MLSDIGVAIITFAITNIDDLLILSIYFGSNKYNSSTVVAGQYVGIISLIFISLSGLIFGRLLEDHWVSLLGILPLGLGLKDLVQLFNNKESDDDDGIKQQKPAVANVALVTIANGGDNIGVYTPLFANVEEWTVLTFVVVFLILTGVWCLFARYVVSHRKIKTLLSKYGKVVLPLFLILLGGFIMKDFVMWFFAS